MSFTNEIPDAPAAECICLLARYGADIDDPVRRGYRARETISLLLHCIHYQDRWCQTQQSLPDKALLEYRPLCTMALLAYGANLSARIEKLRTQMLWDPVAPSLLERGSPTTYADFFTSTLDRNCTDPTHCLRQLMQSPRGAKDVPNFSCLSLPCWVTRGIEQTGALVRFRTAHEANRDAGMAFLAARDGRPLELGKRLRLGKLAEALTRTHELKLVVPQAWRHLQLATGSGRGSGSGSGSEAEDGPQPEPPPPASLVVLATPMEAAWVGVHEECMALLCSEMGLRAPMLRVEFVEARERALMGCCTTGRSKLR